MCAHSTTWQLHPEGCLQQAHTHSEDPAREEKKAAAKKAPRAKKEETPKVENVAASTTLGDLDVLAQLKAQMEKGE